MASEATQDQQLALMDLVREVLARFLNSRPGMRSFSSVEDFEQELWLAAQTAHAIYDPSKGASYLTHMKFRLEKALLDIMRHSDTVSTHVRSDWNRIMKSAEILGDDAPLVAMAHEAGLAYERALSVMREVRSGQTLSIDVETSAAEVRQESFYDPDEYILTVERNAAVRMAVSMLPERHRSVLLMRTLEGISVAEISALLGVTKGRVSQIYSEALSQVKESLEDLIVSELEAEIANDTLT